MICNPAEILTYIRQTTTVSQPDIGLLSMLQPMGERALKTWLQQGIERATYVEYLPLGKDYTLDNTLEDFDVTAQGASPRMRGVGTTRLQLKHLPVWLDDTLEVREQFDAKAGQTPGAFPTSSILVRGTAYWLDLQEDIGTERVSKTGILLRTSLWPREPGSIKVTYTAGWTPAQLMDIAADLKLAALITIAKAYKQASSLKGKGAGGLVSESIGKYSYSRDGQTATMLTGFQVTVPPEAQILAQPFRNYGRMY